jgi:sn-glycerol 3-phosphate transport system ATP-binding protein
MVFQNYALYPHMSVYENMSYGLRIRKMPKAEIERRVKRAADILQIGQLLERKPRQLSGGQRQRVAMGRAIVREPAVFLFDEPLSNLDAKLRVQMRLEIRKLHRELGVTSIYVTHDQVEAMTLADRLVVMNAGVAEQVGAPKDVYTHPATTYVAGFIGSPAMNFLPATIAERGITLSSGQNIGIDVPGLGNLAGRSITVGLRPEHLAIGDGPGAFDFRVDVTEELGADTLLHGPLDGTDIVVRLPGSLGLRAGDQIRLCPDPALVHLFDDKTGRRLALNR